MDACAARRGDSAAMIMPPWPGRLASGASSCGYDDLRTGPPRLDNLQVLRKFIAPRSGVMGPLKRPAAGRYAAHAEAYSIRSGRYTIPFSAVICIVPRRRATLAEPRDKTRGRCSQTSTAPMSGARRSPAAGPALRSNIHCRSARRCRRSLPSSAFRFFWMRPAATFTGCSAFC